MKTRQVSRIAAVAFATAASLACIEGAARADAIPCPDLDRRFAAMAQGATHLEMVSLAFTAADSGCADVVAKLLDGGVPAISRDRDGNSVLTRAAKAGHVQVVDLLIARGADLEERNVQGETALFAAVSANRAAIATRLAAAGARIDAPGRSGVTPLSAAAFNGNDKMVTWLMEHGADAKDMDATGKSAIVYAAARGFTPIVKRLLDAGVDVNRRYGNDLTVLMWAAGHSNDAPEADGLATVDLILARGARLDDADNRGRTALMTAAEMGHDAIVRRLAAAGANTALRDRDGKTALDLASADSVRAAFPR
ncbi:ankyrin repeat domain-containing protein [Alsobacter sp. SYSU M60028]|uniref:Ankyrin repeat domain-containing protein n=1 Tax=Alsobacter ponti TaxID=2962936 RepID=A0ABT1L954_9HYPH|nr:ankyrin repeat domain-containing protein [Alsobacter ponti]MCP8937573.1 ankyrin repeat domain-containing protein [Alsobacter ponti]